MGVEDLWFRVEGRFQHADVVYSHETNQRARFFLDLAENPGLSGARFYAGGRKPFHQPVVAKRAFFGCVGLGVEESGAVWAGLDAVTASDAVTGVHENNAIG